MQRIKFSSFKCRKKVGSFMCSLEGIRKGVNPLTKSHAWPRPRPLMLLSPSLWQNRSPFYFCITLEKICSLKITIPCCFPPSVIKRDFKEVKGSLWQNRSPPHFIFASPLKKSQLHVWLSERKGCTECQIVRIDTTCCTYSTT